MQMHVSLRLTGYCVAAPNVQMHIHAGHIHVQARLVASKVRYVTEGSAVQQGHVLILAAQMLQTV